MISHFFKTTLRNITRNKVYTAISVLGLSVALACCVVLILFVLGQTGYDKYHDNRENIYRVTLDLELLDSGDRFKTATSSILWGPALISEYPEIENFCRVYATRAITFKLNEDVMFEEDNLVYADENAFTFFTWPLLQGDPATVLENPYSVVINESLAATYFRGTDPIGQILTNPQQADQQFIITGVMKDIPYKSHLKPAMVISFRTLNDVYNSDVTAGFSADINQWRNRTTYNYIQLNSRSSKSDLEAKFPDFVDKYVGDTTTSRGYIYHPYLQRLDTIRLEGQDVTETFERGGDLNQLIFFSVIGFFILVIASINFMNLSIARYTTRAREIGVRKIFGATRIKLVGQFLGESIFLTMLALLVAMGLAEIINPLFYYYIDQDFYMPTEELPVIAASVLGIALLVGFFSGIYPAFILSNVQAVKALETRFSLSAKGKYLSKALVVLQFAITLFFVAGTFIVYSQRQFMLNQDLGVKTERVMVIPPNVGRQLFDQIESIRNALLNYPGISGVTVSNGIPGGFNRGDTWGEPGNAGESVVSIGAEFAVDYNYLDLYGLDLVAGRNFDIERATDAAPRVSQSGYELAGIINEAAVRRFGWGSAEEALGKRIVRDPVSNDFSATIIGVVQDFHYNSLQFEIEPAILFIDPNTSAGSRALSIELLPGNVPGSIDHVREVVAPYLGDTPFDFFFVDQFFGEQYEEEQRVMEIFGYISFLTIAIACLGLFGMASFAAESRTKEIGIRKVLGARIANIVSMLSMDFLRLVLFSSVIAVPVSFLVMSRWLEGYAYRIELGPGTFLLAFLVTIVIALLTVSSQALQKARQKPIHTLKYE